MAGRDEQQDEQRDETGLLAGSDAAAPAADAAPTQTPGTTSTAASEPGWPHVDRRTNADRRAEPTGWLSHPFGFRRRKAGRRTGERDNIYVDVYSHRAVAILLAIFLLNIGDALFTLLWLQRGGAEGNPIMQWMLDIGVGAFLFQKCIVVGLWLLILIAHRNYRAARLGLWSTLTVYTLLIAYHLVLVGFDIQPVRREAGELDATGSELSEIAPEQHRDGGLDSQRAIAQSEGS